MKKKIIGRRLPLSTARTTKFRYWFGILLARLKRVFGVTVIPETQIGRSKIGGGLSASKRRVKRPSRFNVL